MNVKENIKRKLFPVVALARMLSGFITYKITGVTPDKSFYAMRWLYFASDGKFTNWFNDWMVRGQSLFQKPLKVKGPFLGLLDEKEIMRGKDLLDKEGIFIPKILLPKQVCLSLQEFARTTLANPRGIPNRKILIDPKNPLSNIYDFDGQDLIENPVIQKVVGDKSLLAVAQNYLGPSTTFAGVRMWWSTSNFAETDTDASAQVYHTDLDTLKWIKIFLYLSEVDEDNGAHVFIAKTHRSKPKSLNRDGRLTDSEVESQFDPKEIIKAVGPMGTIIFEDTVGLHKGMPLKSGERLMLQLIFATTLFGRNYNKIHVGPDAPEDFRKFIHHHSKVYSELIKSPQC